MEQTVRQVDISKMAVANPNGVQAVYSNNIGIQLTNWDVRLIFTEVVPAMDSVSIQLRSLVTLVPAQAKALVMVLGEQLKQYEQMNGEIPWPPKAINVPAKSGAEKAVR